MNFITLLQCGEDRQRSSKAAAVSYAEVGSQNRGSVVGDVDMMEFSSSPHGFLGRGTTILIPSLRLKGCLRKQHCASWKTIRRNRNSRMSFFLGRKKTFWGALCTIDVPPLGQVDD